MTAPITGMYCDRCGARHEFERARPSGAARLRSLTRSVRGYVMNETPTFGDAMTDAWSRLEEDGALEQYAEVQRTFSFCLDCRGYVCHDCWNEKAGRCLTCVPLPGMESVAESAIADRLDLVAGPAPEASPVVPAAASVEEIAIAVVAAEPTGPHDAEAEAEGASIESVDAVPGLAGIAPEPPTVPPTEPDAGAPQGQAGATAEPRADAAAAAGATPAEVRGRSRPRREARPTEPRRADEDADVIAAAVAAGIIVAPAAPSPAAPVAAMEAATERPVTTPSVLSEPEPAPAPVAAVTGWPSDLRTPASAAATEVIAPPPAGAGPEPAAATPAMSAQAGSAPEADVVPVPEPSPAQPTAAPEAVTAPARPARRSDRRRPAPPRRTPSLVHCGQCGLQVPAVARFCRRCGERQGEDAPARA